MGRRYIPPETITNVCIDIASATITDSLSYAAIGQKYGLHHQTVIKIAKRSKDKIASYITDKKTLEQSRVERICQKLMDRLDRDMDNIPNNVIPSSVGIFIDKSRLYRGEPTVIEHTSSLEVGDVLKLDPKDIKDSPPPLPQLKVI